MHTFINAFENLKTRTKLTVCFGAMVVFLLLMGGQAIVGIHQISDRLERTYKNNLLPIKMLGDLRERTQRMSAYVSWHILAYDSATVAKQAEGIVKLDEEIDGILADYAPAIVSDTEQKAYDQFKNGLPAYRAVREKVLGLSKNFSKDAAAELQRTELAEKLAVIHEAIEGLITENTSQAKEGFEAGQQLGSFLTIGTIVVLLLAILLGLVGAWSVTTFLIKNMGNVLEAAQQLQKHNLTFRSTVTTTEEIGQLAQAFNAMAGSLEQAADQTKQALADQAAEIKGLVDAIGKSQATIEFTPDGRVLTANDNFLTCLGYRLEEIKGQHHRMFCEPSYTSSADYTAFWQKLNRGEFDTAVYKRLGKGGKEIWLQASYNPIVDSNGKVYKVVEFATDVTADKTRSADFEGKLKAINKAQAAIEFGLDGAVLTANDNFLNCLGYRLEEIKGQHHRMFCESSYTSSADYTAFWQKLNRGEFDAAVYKQIGKGGKEVWIQASYNPIVDANGKVYKVVKFATDITTQRQAQAATEQLVEEAQTVLGRLAANDLTHEMTGTYQGELAKVKTSINAVVQNLTATIRTVREAVEGVTSGSEEIAKGNEDLSQRTSEQASALEETSASMEEMTSTVKQNADNAKQANQLAANAREIADQGGTVTKKAVDAMGEINKSSSKIADIITVIDEIAFQTNLLALNAAVEAARAGEHGRGFAVVAAEVRNLAQRSATAAKEIKGLINESIQRVTDGSGLVDQSGKTLHEIVSSVKRVSDIIAEITAASQEQASGIDQVNKAIMSMDETTQQNAALVEQTTSAAQSMKEQAKELMRQVEVFKLSMTGASSQSVMSTASKSKMDGAFPPIQRTKALGRGAMKAIGRQPEAVGVATDNGVAQQSLEDTFKEF